MGGEVVGISFGRWQGEPVLAVGTALEGYLYLYRWRDGPLVAGRFPAGAFVVGPVLGDSDGDGETEIHLVDGGGRLRVLEALSSEEAAAYPLFSEVLRLLLADVDGDGRVEAVMATPEGIEVYRRKGPGWTLAGSWGEGVLPLGLAAGDTGGSGREDVIVSDLGGAIRVLSWEEGSLRELGDLPRGPGGAAAALAALDTDGDGKAEILAGEKGGVKFYRREGNRFVPAGRLGTPGLTPGTVVPVTGDDGPYLLVAGPDRYLWWELEWQEGKLRPKLAGGGRLPGHPTYLTAGRAQGKWWLAVGTPVGLYLYPLPLRLRGEDNAALCRITQGIDRGETGAQSWPG